MTTTVEVHNPFVLREALWVAREVAWTDLAPDQVDRVRRLANIIPAQVGPASIGMDNGTRDALQMCLAHFRQTRTWYWLREDLCEALTELERGMAA